MPALRPRYPWCWWCSSKLWGGKFRIVDTHGGEVSVHVACAQEMKETGDGWEVQN